MCNFARYSQNAGVASAENETESEWWNQQEKLFPHTNPQFTHTNNNKQYYLLATPSLYLASSLTTRVKILATLFGLDTGTRVLSIVKNVNACLLACCKAVCCALSCKMGTYCKRN